MTTESNHLRRLLVLHCGRFSGSADGLVRGWRNLDVPIDVESIDIRPRLLTGWSAKLTAVSNTLVRSGIRALRQNGGFHDELKRSPWYLRQMQTVVRQLADKRTFDAAVVIGTLTPGAELRRRYSLYTDMPILGNLDFPDGPERVRYWSKCLPHERRNIDRAERIFTMSEFARSVLIDRYGVAPGRVLRVNAGCNAPIRPPREHRPEPDCPGVLFVGVNWERKGGPILLKAFLRVRRRVPDARLTVVGCSPPIRREGVVVVGKVPPTAVGYYLREANVLCMTSRREPFGIVYLEAMQAETPVIAADYGAAIDFVRNGATGYRVPYGDVDALSDRIERILSNPVEARRMGRRGRALVESEYTWPRTAAAMWNAMKTPVPV